MNSAISKQKRGVIYVVTGGRSYIGELLTSVESLRRYEPDLSITVFSSFPIPSRYGLVRKELNLKENPHKLKVYSIRRSPYEQTLFLDTDTNIRGPLQPLFAELEGRDFCAANAHLADYSVRPPKFIEMVKPGEYNTGVLLYRSTTATHAFLSRWEAEVCAFNSDDMWAGHNGDQRFFNQLISKRVRKECGLNWGDLDNVKWNCRGIAVNAVNALGRWPDVKILHHRTTRMKARKLMYSVTAPAIARVIAGKSWKFATMPFRKFRFDP